MKHNYYKIMQVVLFQLNLQNADNILHFVKLSHYRTGQTLRAPSGCGSQNFRCSVNEGDKAVSPMPRLPPPTQEISLALTSVRGGVDLRAMVKSEGFGQ
jgi:hypothetical protein